jgi:glycosyltransferase involved in cell wall biosynthesis
MPYTALTRTPRAGGAFARDVRTFRRELRRQRADLLVVVTTVLPSALVAARIARVPAVVYAAEVHEGRSGGALTRGTAALASGVICCSRLVAGQFRRGAAPLTVAYPPIDARHAHGDREAGRRLLGCEGADPLVAVVGSLSRGRGQDLAIRALPAIRSQATSARLVLVGDPHPRGVDREYAAELRALAAELGVAGAVAFPGALADLSDLYAAADVVVNPARVPESFGRVAAEALLAGRPVVSADVGAVREVLRDGVDGVLVPPERPDSLAAAVLGLWRDPKAGRRMAAAGAERVRAEFGAEQDLAAWRSVIESVST